ncbi:MAG: aminotransferase class V-fold PLP-dependent enzyme [Bacteroidia bacterium]|nr:aminotransferase class V-fold PLP-dependent enzyme [Bacteroidia bacterium]MDW8158707.1 aminotransferase class V-fold PLP-dependent enzyme [Bacteroidia bacterium]
MQQSIAGMLSVSMLQSSLWQQEWKEILAKYKDRSPQAVAEDEDFWFYVQQAYITSPHIINLNNGGVSPHPLPVHQQHVQLLEQANIAPAYQMWQIIDKGREPIRQKLAQLGGCSAEEIAITRNTTESLDLVIMGLDLKEGDEVVLTKQDYPNMINAWKMREKRDKIKLNWINLELPIEKDEIFVDYFTNAFTPKTKVVQLTHMINWTGQIMPVAKIAREAKKRGIKVIVDGAHTFAQFKFSIPELGGDYFGTSLHKWLSAPFGTGMLWVKKENIKELWPLFPNHEFDSDNIRKFEAMGTRNMCAEMAIEAAIDFHNGIGIERKEARLRYLKNYWAERASRIPGVKLFTSLNKNYSCALALFSIENAKPEDIQQHLFSKYRIYTVTIEWENIKGIRVTPHVYTKLSELDLLVMGIQDFVNTQVAKK